MRVRTDQLPPEVAEPGRERETAHGQPAPAVGEDGGTGGTGRLLGGGREQRRSPASDGLCACIEKQEQTSRRPRRRGASVVRHDDLGAGGQLAADETEQRRRRLVRRPARRRNDEAHRVLRRRPACCACRRRVARGQGARRGAAGWPAHPAPVEKRPRAQRVLRLECGSPGCCVRDENPGDRVTSAGAILHAGGEPRQVLEVEVHRPEPHEIVDVRLPVHRVGITEIKRRLWGRSRPCHGSRRSAGRVATAAC